jgi:hypothetical protein
MLILSILSGSYGSFYSGSVTQRFVVIAVYMLCFSRCVQDVADTKPKR